MSNYVDSKVWLSVPGGVEGWDIDDLNKCIDEWNSPSNKLVRSLGTFFQWLSYHEGRTINGFSFWKSKLDSQVHPIKGD